MTDWKDQQIQSYLKSISLEAVNARRKDMGLESIDKLGGSTIEEKRKLGTKLDKFEHDGKKFYHIISQTAEYSRRKDPTEERQYKD